MTYYRIHPNNAAPFSSENAYSSLQMGEDEVLTPSTMKCECCNGADDMDAVAVCEENHTWLYQDDGPDAYCRECEWCGACGGTGAMGRDRGYSCCESLEALAQHDYLDFELTNSTLVAFEGTVVGRGANMEPLVVPFGACTVLEGTFEVLLAAELAA